MQTAGRFCGKLRAAAGTALFQRRYLERPGAMSGQHSRSPDFAKNDLFAKIKRPDMTHDPCFDSMFENGNPTIPTLTLESMTDVTAETESYRNFYKYFHKDADRFAISKLTPGDTLVAREAFGKLQMLNAYNEWWDRVFRDFPAFKLTITAPVQQEWQEYVLEALSAIHQPESLRPRARAFIERMSTERNLPYWATMRIMERLMDALDTLPGMTNNDRRLQRVCLTVVMKATMNGYADLPWGSEELNNPIFMDVTPVRAFHEPKLRDAMLDVDGAGGKAAVEAGAEAKKAEAATQE